MLHPRTVIHEIKEIQPLQEGDNPKNSYYSVLKAGDELMFFSIRFTAPLEADFSSDEHDAHPRALTPRELRLIGAAAHSESIVDAVQEIERRDGTFSTTAYISTLRKPNWGHCYNEVK